eukprot:scaffold166973_cov18-Tisochrysis_lutea.AAC.1
MEAHELRAGLTEADGRANLSDWRAEAAMSQMSKQERPCRRWASKQFTLACSSGHVADGQAADCVGPCATRRCRGFSSLVVQGHPLNEHKTLDRELNAARQESEELMRQVSQSAAEHERAQGAAKVAAKLRLDALIQNLVAATAAFGCADPTVSVHRPLQHRVAS